MLEVLHKIPGPFYLLIYAGIAVIGGLILHMRWKFCKTDLPNGLFENPVPSEIAYLVGRENHVLRTTVISLWNRGLIRTDIENKSTVLFPASDGDHSSLNEIEKIVLHAVRNRMFLNQLLLQVGVLKQIKNRMSEVKSRFEKQGLFHSVSEGNRLTNEASLLWMVLMVFGGIKVIMGIYYQHPFTLLILEMIIATLLIIGYVTNNKTLTPCGKKAIKQLKKKHEWIKARVKSEGLFDEDTIAVMGVALFGAGILAGQGGGYQAFSSMYTSGNSGGCGGSGCGSGGGGGCGGGCGGCGS